MKRMLSILMSFLLLWSLALPAAAAETAATLRLEKTEGTVSVSNASGKSVTITKGMRLYSGYTISTEKDSYAYVSLDSTKAVKLDASSKAEVQKSGKKLELTATAGKLFFNVTAPVEKDESLNIRTSTMVTGVRGTSGWVEVTNRFTSRVHLLEGTLTVTSSEPATGQMRQATITGGQTATATLKGLDQPGRQMTLTVTNLQEKQVPGFVAVEVAKDPALQGKIAAKSPLSIPSIIGDAKNRLAEEQKAADTAQKTLNKELDKIGADDVKQVFDSPTAKPDDDDDDDDEPYVPPTTPETPTEPTRSEILELVDPTPEQLTAALARTDVARVEVKDASDALGYGSYAVGDGQTLSIQSGTFTVGSNQTLTVAQTGALEIAGESAADTTSAGAALQVDGTVTINGSVTNSGSVSGVGTVNFNGNTTNSGSISTAGTMNVNSSLTNNGTINVTGTMNVSGSMTNSGTITILSETSLHVLNGGSLTNNGTINVGDGANPGLLEVQGGGTLNNNSGGSITSASTAISVTGGNVTVSGGTVSSSSSTEAAISLTGGTVTVSDKGLVSNTGSVSTDSNMRGTGIRATGGTVLMQGGEVSGGSGVGIEARKGEVTISGGQVTSTGGAVNSPAGTGIKMTSGKLDFLGGAVTSNSAGISVSGGTLNVQKGTITSSYGAGIDMTGGNGTISGGTFTSTNAMGISISAGSLELKGNVTSKGGSSSHGIQVTGTNADVNITDGKITCSGLAGMYVTAGTVNISGGEVSSQSDTTIIVNETEYYDYGGTVNVSGGTVSNDSASGTAIQVTAANGTVNITGGTVESNGIGVAANAGTTRISGTGSVTGGSYGILVKDATVEISGGTVTLTAPVLTGDTEVLPGYAVSGPFTFSGTAKLRAYSNQSLFRSSDINDGTDYSKQLEQLKPGTDGYYTFELPIAV